jgi:phospholipase/carboxylesterase
MANDLSLFEHVILENTTPKTLFLFHGTGGTKKDFLFLDQALDHKYTLVGLTGNVDERGMKRFFKRHDEGVFDEESIKEESAKLDRFITEWVKTHYLKLDDTAFLGYSNGANILLSTLFLYPAHFLNMVLLHPMLPLEPPTGLDLSGKRIFVSFGAEDKMVTRAQSELVIQTLTSLGAEVTAKEYPGGHAMTQAEVDDLVAFLSHAV